MCFSFLDPIAGYAVRKPRESRVKQLVGMMDPLKVLNNHALIVLDDTVPEWKDNNVTPAVFRQWLEDNNYQAIDRFKPMVIAGRHSSKAFLQWRNASRERQNNMNYLPLRQCKFYLKSELPVKDAVAIGGLDNFENQLQAKGAEEFFSFTSQVALFHQVRLDKSHVWV